MAWWGLLATGAAWGQSPGAELVFTNGTIHLDAANTATALAVAGGQVVAVGEAALAAVHPGTRTVNLAQGAVWPGFLDSHCHYLGGSFIALGVNLNTTPPLADLAAVRAAVESWIGGPTDLGPSTWIFGFGWNPATIANPEGRGLDDIARPIVLIDGGGHTALANAEALRRGRIVADTTVVGGEIVRDAQGQATGWLKENAVGLVLATAMQETPDAVFGAAVPQLTAMLAAMGVTGISDIMGMPGLPITGRERIYMALEQRGALPLRVHYYVPVYQVADAEPVWREYLKPEHSTALVRFAGGKIWVDGGLDSGGADTSFPHRHTPTRYFDLPALRALVAVAEALGVPVQFHVNGDRALEDTLRALEEARQQSGGRLQRHVLVHLPFASAAHLSRIQALGVTVAGQPIFWSPIGYATELLEYGEPAARVYDYEAVIGAGIRLGFGTDWPAVDNPLADFMPLRGLAVATSLEGRPGDTRRLTAGQFLRGYTEGSAATVSRPDLGNLRPGAAADLVVFDRDPLTASAGEVPGIHVTQTWLNGVLVAGQVPLLLESRYGEGTLTLTWTGTATLQAAPVVEGPYVSITGAASPFVLTNFSARSQFFRLLAP